MEAFIYCIKEQVNTLKEAAYGERNQLKLGLVAWAEREIKYAESLAFRPQPKARECNGIDILALEPLYTLDLAVSLYILLCRGFDKINKNYGECFAYNCRRHVDAISLLTEINIKAWVTSPTIPKDKPFLQKTLAKKILKNAGLKHPYDHRVVGARINAAHPERQKTSNYCYGESHVFMAAVKNQYFFQLNANTTSTINIRNKFKHPVWGLNTRTFIEASLTGNCFDHFISEAFYDQLYERKRRSLNVTDPQQTIEFVAPGAKSYIQKRHRYTGHSFLDKFSLFLEMVISENSISCIQYNAGFENNKTDGHCVTLACPPRTNTIIFFDPQLGEYQFSVTQHFFDSFCLMHQGDFSIFGGNRTKKISDYILDSMKNKTLESEFLSFMFCYMFQSHFLEIYPANVIYPNFFENLIVTTAQF